MKTHVLLMSLLCMTKGIMYAAEVAAPQPGFFQQHTNAVRQEIAQMIPNDDDLDKLALAYPNDPILQQEQHNRLDLLQYWTRPHIESRSMPSAGGFSPAFSPDGNYLAYIRMNGKLVLLFVPTGYAIPIPKELKRASSFAFSPDTNILAVVADGVKLWDLRTNQVTQLDPSYGEGENPAATVAFSPDGTLAVGHEKWIIRLWNVENHIELPPLKVPKFYSLGNVSITNIVFSHNGKQLAAVFKTHGFNASRGTIIWDVENSIALKNLKDFGNGTLRLKWASKAGIIAMQSDYKSFELWSAKEDVMSITFEMLWLKHHDEVIEDIALSPNGTIVATEHLDGKIRLWNAQNGDLLTTLGVGEKRNVTLLSKNIMTFSPNGKTLAVFCNDEVKLYYAEK